MTIMKKINIFEDYQNRVKIMKEKYSWEVDINDDDTLSDFISRMDINSLTKQELGILLFYNNMVQSNAMNPFGDCEFYVKIPVGE